WDRGASRLKTVPCPVAATPWASEAGVVSVVAAGLQPRRPARTRVARMEYAFFICAKIEYVLIPGMREVGPEVPHKTDRVLDALECDDAPFVLRPIGFGGPPGHDDRQLGVLHELIDEVPELPVHRIGIDQQDGLGIAPADGRKGAFEGDVAAQVRHRDALLA